MESTIRLFRALPIKQKKKRKPTKPLLKETISRGFIFSPEVVYNYPESELIRMAKGIGLTPEQMNSSFHKSWQKIKEAGIEQLIVEQLAHYLTTYGKEHPKEYLIEKEEQWGVDNLAEKIIELPDFKSDKIQDESYVYIPKEKLEIPELDIKGIKLIVIKGYTKKELKEKLMNLLGSGIALSEDTMTDVVDIALFVELDEKDIKDIRNKEVKTALYSYLDLFPENPVEFLRYAVYKSTNKTLLIKDKATIEEIKSKDNLDVLRLFLRYKKKYGLERLAEIFYRFKPLFLALRTNSRMKTTVNRIRKLAKKYHRPMREDYLNEITAKIKRRETIIVKKLGTELSKVNVFRKIRLAYALKFRTKDVSSILYRIRNGKGYATDFSFDGKKRSSLILDIVLKSIAKDINVKGKKIYIPEYMHYTLPATEKQFTGYFPTGTYVSIPKDMVFGIHWENVRNHRIDLDLSMISPSTGKIGWDSSYRTEDKSILFSGDVTDAHRGASELFYVRRQNSESFIMFVNYYNYDEEENLDVPFKIIVAKEHVNDFKENYMVNPNNVVSVANTKISKREKILGLITTSESDCRFYFVETSIGKSITSSSNSKFTENARRYLFDYYTNTITLNEVLEKAGAKIVTVKGKCDIDLSPEALEKDTILNLMK